MTWLTEDKADALCTIIAVGFIQSQTRGLRTTFGYDTGASQDETAAHEALQAALRRRNVNVTINQLVDKKNEPMILAKTKTAFDEAVLEGIREPFGKFVNSAEQRINVQLGTAPCGAYVGGMLKNTELCISGPSDVALAGVPKYRNLEKAQSDAMKQAFDRAKKASNIIWDFICGDAQSIQWNTVYIAPGTPRKVTADYKPGYLFQSVHGMVRAIMDYGDHMTNLGTCFELALGNSTNKVASCLPCSIFMSACELPATHTHLGRGDNWNFPASHRRYAAWKASVISHFASGFELLHDIPIVAEVREHVSLDHIPEAFLEALTFEGPFYKKMKKTLGL